MTMNQLRGSKNQLLNLYKSVSVRLFWNNLKVKRTVATQYNNQENKGRKHDSQNQQRSSMHEGG